MNKALVVGFLFVFILMLFTVSCVPGPNDVEKTPNRKGKVASFWKGLWHGLISPITFVVFVFTKNVRFHEVHNNGGWYDFGFVLGADRLTQIHETDRR